MTRWLFTTCLTIIACGGSRTTPSTDAALRANEGVYEFSASVPSREVGQTIRVQGTLSIIEDSLFIQSPNGCYDAAYRGPGNPNGVPSGPNYKIVSCGGALLAFNRRDPVKSAQWYATVPVPKQRNACVEYRMNEARRQVCIRYQPETYYTYESRSGGVLVKLIQ